MLMELMRCTCGSIPIVLDRTEFRDIPKRWWEFWRLGRAPKQVSIFIAWLQCPCGVKGPEMKYIGPRWSTSIGWTTAPEDKHEVVRGGAKKAWDEFQVEHWKKEKQNQNCVPFVVRKS